MKKYSAILLLVVACNQLVYDSIYYEMMHRAMKGPLTRNKLMERYNAIQVLRKLCNGQKSTWEKENTSGIIGGKGP
jgi:hypothetical protein